MAIAPLHGDLPLPLPSDAHVIVTGATPGMLPPPAYTAVCRLRCGREVWQAKTLATELPPVVPMEYTMTFPMVGLSAITTTVVASFVSGQPSADACYAVARSGLALEVWLADTQNWIMFSEADRHRWDVIRRQGVSAPYEVYVLAQLVAPPDSQCTIA